MIGTQEIIALLIVIAVVGFALYRRLRKKSAGKSGCDDCSDEPGPREEKTVHFYRKQD